MEMRYGYMIPIGIVLAIALTAIWIRHISTKQKFNTGVKAANLEMLKNDPYYKRKKIEYLVARTILWISITGVIVSSAYICARPYIFKQIQQERYNRDIIICMDVSSSVNDLNMKLTKELQETVRNLQGERVGIVMFNTSPVLLSPLTDDYEYTIEQLENIRQAIKVTDSKLSVIGNSEWLYWYDFLYGGTLVGNDERGSSLIGDGLLGAVFNFPRFDKDRTKIVIFATDNDPYGEEYATLPVAADYCVKNNIVVYGIGTKSMYAADKKEMEAAMIKTGGKFYLEENASTFSKIVEDIESQSASLIKGKTIIKEIESPMSGFRALCIFLALAIVSAIVLLQIDIPWIARQVIAIGLVIALFFMFVKPAMHSTYGDEREIKTNSNLNVLFVVDSTLSMIAQDYNGEEERLTGVKQDCNEIIDELLGAKVGVVSFNNTASILCPYTNNSEHAKNCIMSIYPVDTLYARGTDMNVTKDTVLTMLRDNTKEGDKTAVFFVSDGEVTSEQMLESYAELAPYISGGAVLGYGTAAGGLMFEPPRYDGEEIRPVMDRTSYPYTEAVSKIDEDNLRRIANDMGIKYINMNDQSGLSGVLNSLKGDINLTYEVSDVSEDNAPEVYKFENNWWILAAAVLMLYVFEAVHVIRKR